MQSLITKYEIKSLEKEEKHIRPIDFTFKNDSNSTQKKDVPG